jgi:hypothetical protein
MKPLTAYQLGIAHGRLRKPAQPDLYKTAKARRLYMQGYEEGSKLPSLEGWLHA